LAEFRDNKEEIMRRFPGLVLHGKVPQAELSRALRRAGLLVFPSMSYESAGLAVVEAQASGCPVVAFDAGGTADYVVEQLGVLLKDNEKPMETLRDTIGALLRDRPRMIEMSRRAESYRRERTWERPARGIMALPERAAAHRRDAPIAERREPLRRVQNVAEVSIETLLRDHDRIAQQEFVPDAELASIVAGRPGEAWPYFVRGLRLESAGNAAAAESAYKAAIERANAHDWQPYFRLALLHADRRQLVQASECARVVLERVPRFPLRAQLEQLIAVAGSASGTTGILR